MLIIVCMCFGTLYFQPQIPSHYKPTTNSQPTQNPTTKPTKLNKISSSNTTDDVENEEETYSQQNIFLMKIMTFLYGVLALIGWYQAWSTTDTAHKQLRAYVSVEVNLPIEQTDFLKYEFKGIIKNVGHTPANDVIQSGAVKFMNPNDLVNQHPLTWSEEASRAVMGAGTEKTFSIWADRLFTPVEIQEMHTGDRRLCAYGTIKYKDIFGKKRFTNYAFYVGWGDKNLPVCWHCTYHNEAN